MENVAADSAITFDKAFFISRNNMPPASLSLSVIRDIPLVRTGDDLAAIILQAMSSCGYEFENNDIIAIAQKIVSKAQGRIVNLAEVTPSKEAVRLAREINKDPRQIELVLAEAKTVIACKPGVIIVEHHSGVILANAGIDHSNVSADGEGEYVSLLPEDSNRSAGDIKQAIESRCGKKIGVLITDSIGRPWRLGTTGIALGSAGILPLRDLRGNRDMFGHELMVSETADADSLASAACLLMGEADNATPVVLIRGFECIDTQLDSRQLLRPEEEDLFR